MGNGTVNGVKIKQQAGLQGNREQTLLYCKHSSVRLLTASRTMRLALAYCQPGRADIGLQLDKTTSHEAFPADLPAVPGPHWAKWRALPGMPTGIALAATHLRRLRHPVTPGNIRSALSSLSKNPFATQRLPGSVWLSGSRRPMDTAVEISAGPDRRAIAWRITGSTRPGKQQ